ncbi:metallophosphoesterase [Chitinophaga japonensis]|uniref:Calcineurin-like phosphoesterase family protein n=1 Tax=Chitinophaga japonensis TaxID=104662 RepID=A0A562ST33_CHIJA|nr:metallophosphoesterase [Chitinophaga japonensis]TWI83956.1 calcineurin-like phosphoesterase family protein [Chitinophaga japonensis]
MNAVTDGPYIFYQGNRILVKSIATRSGKPQPQTAYFTPQQKAAITVNCTFPGHPGWNFSIPLKEALHPEPAVFPEAARIFAISDIEGNFEAFRHLLLAGGVIDEQYNWTFGPGHLVMNGDCFDRGEHVTECLWLLYGLEEKARQQGGYVHFILGNHEIMNMTHDLRYVHEKYLVSARLLRKDYGLFYTPDTELGRWLATKNIMEKIGPVLFVHGGVSAAVNALPYSLAELNGLCRPWYFMPPLAAPAQLAVLYDLLFSSDAPFWYRGYAMGGATLQQVAATLEKFDVRHIVIGHTTVEQATAFFEGKVIDIDTPHAFGMSEGVLIKQGKIWRVGKEGRGKRMV